MLQGPENWCQEPPPVQPSMSERHQGSKMFCLLCIVCLFVVFSCLSLLFGSFVWAFCRSFTFTCRILQGSIVVIVLFVCLSVYLLCFVCLFVVCSYLSNANITLLAGSFRVQLLRGSSKGWKHQDSSWTGYLRLDSWSFLNFCLFLLFQVSTMWPR